MQLPLLKNLDTLQTRWKSILDPILANPIATASTLTNIGLVVGNNSIPHLLDRKMQGWMISDINAAASIYRSQPFNASTITLNSSAVCIINLVVF